MDKMLFKIRYRLLELIVELEDPRGKVQRSLLIDLTARDILKVLEPITPKKKKIH